MKMWIARQQKNFTKDCAKTKPVAFILFIMFLIPVVCDIFRFGILIKRVKELESLLGERREILPSREKEFSSKWECSIEIKNIQNDEWCTITISKPISITAILFSDYTNLLLIGFENDRVSSVSCCK